mmetsp:Transcript_39663/g.86451  ORF Transcript_39663/g.86451 Transcript_39663/m.86451 type:complete len:211 (+) Transcript_39663:678-1310(+)
MNNTGMTFNSVKSKRDSKKIETIEETNEENFDIDNVRADMTIVKNTVKNTMYSSGLNNTSKEEKDGLKTQINELKTIIEFKENETKNTIKKYHQQIARKRTIELDIAECNKQMKFLLENDNKLKGVVDNQKNQILQLDRKRRGEQNVLVETDLIEQKAYLEDKLKSAREELNSLKNSKQSKNKKMDRTVMELVKENNELKKQLMSLKSNM